MSCKPGSNLDRNRPDSLPGILADEGFRLFFPLSAFYAALFPLVWGLAFQFDLPMARDIPPSLWHGHEMLVGAYGAALIGFLTTAAPEWTDTNPLRGRNLWMLAALWATGRLIGILGWDRLSTVSAFTDLGWMAFLIVYMLRLSVLGRTDRLLAFVFWMLILLTCTLTARFAFIIGEITLASRAITLVGYAYWGLLGLALARITVPVTNLVLDPSERSSPFRPHPGRLHLAPGLVLIVLAAKALDLSPAICGYLLLASGAAFLDRVAEAFIGREARKAEILMLAGASGLTGIGLLLSGCALLGAPWQEITGLHIAFMGGLGLGVYAVFCIASLLHTGRTLGIPRMARLGSLLLVIATILRVSPDFGFDLPGSLHVFAIMIWGLAFLFWILSYLPMLTKPADF